MIHIQDPKVSLSAPIFNKRQTNYQPNIFTESKQEFSELEKKIVVLVINQIGHMSLKGQLTDGVNVVFQIPFTELTRARYDLISAAAETLQRKQLRYRNDEIQKFDFITPFPRVRSEVVDGKKVIEVTMLADVVPHFAELGQRYTKYECDVMLSLSSVYAQRMFEIVSMFSNRNQKQFTYTVIELREMLNCPESYRYVDFKVNALELAQRELNQKAGIILEWVPSAKKGKSIVELTFCIKTHQQIAADAVSNDRQQVGQMSLSEAVATARQLMKNYQLKEWQKDLIVKESTLLNVFFRVDSELGNGLRTNIKNPTAYLIKSLGMDQMKAPRKTKNNVSTSSLAQGPSIPIGGIKPIQSLFGDILPPK